MIKHLRQKFEYRLAIGGDIRVHTEGPAKDLGYM